MSDKESPQHDTDTEVDSTQLDSSNNSSESEDSQSENSEYETEGESIVSKEEENCLRYFLGIGIAEKAVRMWFDTVIPADQLENHLNSHEKKLLKNSNTEQISTLFPGYGPVASTSFDISLLYKIIRKTTKVRKPRQDWGGTPDPMDINPSDDLERVRICRNSICHGPQSISNTEFEKKWKELKEVIQRLAGGQLDGEINSLQDKDLDHAARSSVKRSLVVLTEKLQNVQKRVEDHIQKHIREQFQKKIQKWREEDKLFAKVPAYQSVRDKLRSLPFVTVSGSGGRGKTFLIRHIALELAHEGYEIIPVSAIEEIPLYGKLYFKQLFVIDDILGVYGLDMSLYNNLSRQSENVLSLLESGSKLLMSCRSVVFKESKSLNSFVTDINHVIDLDDEENELSDESMKNILENHLQKKYFEDFNIPRKLPMFPLLCRLFSTYEKYQSEGENFFLHPYQCIFSDLDKMRKLNKLHYAGLVYCVIKDNCVSPKSLDRKCLKEVYECCRLNRSTSNSELEDALQVLVGSYLMQNTDGKYSLIHDSLFEIVAVHFGRCFQDFFIEHCTSTSIYNLLTFVDEGSTCCENLIPVFGNHFSVLVDRIICDIKRFNLYEVFSRIGQFSQNEAFVSVFYKTLKKSSYDEFKQLFFEVETNEHLNKKTKKLFHELDQICDNIFEAKKFSAIDFSLSLLNKPRVRVVDWIIAYNHVGLLSGLIKIVREKSQPVEEKACFTDENSQDILGVIFGNDLESHSFCLRLACSSRSLDMVKFILSCVKHESINYLDNQNQWPLMTASGAGCTDIVKILLKEGANVNLCDKDNFSCLNCSCLLGQYDVAETLIKEGADINLCTVDGMSPFKAAMMSGNVHLVRYLMKNGAVWNEDNLSPLHFSSYLGNLEILKHFINSDPELKIDVRCLSAACENGQSTIVKYLIDKVDVNEVCDECDPALHSAATSGHLAIVEYLVEHGADVNLLSSSKENPLYFAAMKGHLHIIRYLLDHGADICGSIDTSSLCVASGEGYLEVVEELIKRGADVNLCDRNEQSPLCYASKSGHLKTVKFLLQNDADINVGASCLSSACKGGHLDVVEFLINKVNVNQVSDICDPPIHCASGQGHIEVIKFLVDHEANVNLLNSSRDSPLCCAVENRQLSVVEYLVEHGANVNQAIDIAIEVGQEHILDFMLKHLN